MEKWNCPFKYEDQCSLVFQIKSLDTGGFKQYSPPFMHLFSVVPGSIFMFIKCFLRFPCLFPNLRWIHMHSRIFTTSSKHQIEEENPLEKKMTIESLDSSISFKSSSEMAILPSRSRSSLRRTKPLWCKAAYKWSCVCLRLWNSRHHKSIELSSYKDEKEMTKRLGWSWEPCSWNTSYPQLTL